MDICVQLAAPLKRVGVSLGMGPRLDGRNAMLSRWKTDNAGTSNDDQITLPLVDGGSYDFWVSWGDGTTAYITAWDDAAKTHTYPAAGSYNVIVTGTVERWEFAGGGDCLKLVNVARWGPLLVGSHAGKFSGCANMDCTATDTLDVSTVTSTYGMFRNCALFNQAIGDWDVSGVESMYNMFYGATAFNQDIGAWDVSGVESMYNMFSGATAFNQDIGAWDVSGVTNMRYMFNWAVAFDQDIGGWDVTALTDATNMFLSATLSTANYDALLIGWEAQAVQDNVAFHGGNSKYSAGAAATARTALVNDHSWTITDGGQA